jgi:cytochrome c oxidase subunit II
MLQSVQSAIHHAGRGAGWFGEPAWAAMLGVTLAFVLVMWLAIAGVGARSRPATPRRTRWAGGFAFPLLALTAVAVYALIIGEAFSQDAPLRIEMTSRDSWWEVRYEPRSEERVLANELRVPLQRTVEVILTAGQGTSRLRVPALALDVAAAPGERRRFLLTADQSGEFPAEDAALAVVAQESEHFDEWVARQSAPSVIPTDPGVQYGRESFFRAGCDGCHAIRGTAARGPSGPDLTHVGSRRSLAADPLDGHLRLALQAAADSDAGLADERHEVRALATYLASLK